MYSVGPEVPSKKRPDEQTEETPKVFSLKDVSFYFTINTSLDYLKKITNKHKKVNLYYTIELE